jgi:monoamine oxidase
MTTMPLLPRPTFHVVIVGAGLAGLMMGILLDKMNIPYLILERAPKVKPLGMTLPLLLVAWVSFHPTHTKKQDTPFLTGVLTLPSSLIPFSTSLWMSPPFF